MGTCFMMTTGKVWRSGSSLVETCMGRESLLHDMGWRLKFWNRRRHMVMMPTLCLARGLKGYYFWRVRTF